MDRWGQVHLGMWLQCLHQTASSNAAVFLAAPPQSQLSLVACVLTDPTADLYLLQEVILSHQGGSLHPPTPPKSCCELSDSSYNTFIWCCGCSGSYRAFPSHILEGHHGPPPSAKPLWNTQRWIDRWREELLDLSQIWFVTVSCLMIAQQLKEPVPNLALLKCYRTARALPACAVWVNIGHLNFRKKELQALHSGSVCGIFERFQSKTLAPCIM